MNYELSVQIAKEKSQAWRHQADLERQVKDANRFSFKLPQFHLPRLRRVSRKPA
jgi:hypothetical protein